ncbi:hypothetical protein SDC9_86045 [bioreactor metagenome]|uniref:Uncharacterized protein n=1 Tax=bioreactor metagenome TaxID=1076179 RepID=A0A644ZEV9_9ZZZZ
MSFKNDLIQQISSDLKISKFIGEEQNDYLNRIIYSAIAMWLIHSTWDKKFKENYSRIGVSKTYLTRKISKLISEYIAIFPSFKDYLDELTEAQFAAKLREIYEKSGYIVNTGFDEYVLASSPKVVRVNDGWLIIRNGFNNVTTKVVGLGTFNKINSISEPCHIDILFYLPKMNAKKWTTEYIKKLKWADATRLGEETQFFNAKIMKSFSECWVEQFPDGCDITLYKNNNWDYGFAKKSNLGIVGVKITEWIIGQGNNETEKLFDNDVRRFMYGLKAINKNEAKAIVYKKIDHVELKFLNKLPTRELTALQFFGWRRNRFSNETNYIIPYELFDSVKYIIEKLSIVIEEK